MNGNLDQYQDVANSVQGPSVGGVGGGAEQPRRGC